MVTRAEAESYTKLLAVMARLRPDVKLLMLAPRIVTAAKWLMREYRARLCDAGHGPFPGGNTPSSGLVAAYILVQACDQLNLFGFGGGGDASAGLSLGGGELDRLSTRGDRRGDRLGDARCVEGYCSRLLAAILV